MPIHVKYGYTKHFMKEQNTSTTILEEINMQNDFGIVLDQNMSFMNHIAKSANKTSFMITATQRFFESTGKMIFLNYINSSPEPT